MIETVGNQPWVKGGKVGMGGISFSGITQLFTAGTQPPHLAAISPMSVTDDRYLASVYPGGIFNDGLRARAGSPRGWRTPRPAPEGGQDWAKALTQAGDEHCIDNQRLRLQTHRRRCSASRAKARTATPSASTSARPRPWIDKIEVPVFLGRAVPGRADRRPLRREPLEARRQRGRVDHAAERRPRRLPRAELDRRAGSSS